MIFAGTELQEIVRACQRVRKASAATRYVAAARKKITAKHRATPSRRPGAVRIAQSANGVGVRSGAYEMRLARQRLLRKGLPVMVLLAISISSDSSGYRLSAADAGVEFPAI